MRTHAHKSRFSEQQAHIRLGYLIAYLLNSRAVKIWPGWLFLLLGLAVADASYGQGTGGTSLCSAIPEMWTARPGSMSGEPTGYSYDDFGADLRKPIGGWDKYYAERIITEKESNGSTYTKVSTLTELTNALNQSSMRPITDTTIDTIFVVGSVEIKLLSTLTIPRNVTLASNRGQTLLDVNDDHVSDGFALGALLYTDKVVGSDDMLHITGNNVRITGLRLRGPQREVHPWGEHHDWIGIRNGFRNTSGNQNLEVDNCELFQWPQSAIYVAHEGTACVRNNYIHHNQRWERGYGVGLQGSAKVSIEENLFAFNRHCVAGTGYPTQEYTASHNVVLASNNPPFDMHALIESCPGGWDCTTAQGQSWSFPTGVSNDRIAGRKIDITKNTVASVTNEHKPMDLAKRRTGKNAGRFGPIADVYLRGVPWLESRVDSNSFARPSGGYFTQLRVGSRPNVITTPNKDGRVWNQIDSKRSFFERFGDVFQEKGETTIPANGHFALEDWPYQWSANSGSRLSPHTSGYYGLEKDSNKRTWRVEDGKATTKSDPSNDRIGEMRSKRFQINKNYVSFRIAGFKYEDVTGGGTECISDDSKYANQVAMLSAHNDSVIFKENVPCAESFVLYAHDLRSYNDNDNNNDTWAYFVLSDGDWHNGGWIEVDDIYFFDGAPAKPDDLSAEVDYEGVSSFDDIRLNYRLLKSMGRHRNTKLGRPQ